MVYIASRLNNYKKVNELSQKMQELGEENAFNWAGLGAPTSDISFDILKSIAEKELAAVHLADAIIAVPSPDFGRGSNIEIGIALSLGKRVIIPVTSSSVICDLQKLSDLYSVNLITYLVNNEDSLPESILKEMSNDMPASSDEILTSYLDSLCREDEVILNGPPDATKGILIGMGLGLGKNIKIYYENGSEKDGDVSGFYTLSSVEKIVTPLIGSELEE